MAASESFDYIVAGAGLAGCVVASRLKQAKPDLSIALIEAGSQDINNPQILSPTGAFALAGTELHHTYQTVPQRALKNRSIRFAGGRTVGGGSAVNYAGWTRGHRVSYDTWAQLVGDDRWSYNNLLPYFKKSETYHDRNLDTAQQHGYDGPIHTSSGGRDFPLAQDIREAMISSGYRFNSDMNGGDPNGVAALTETWHEGKRSFAANSYKLTGVTIIDNCHVAKLILTQAAPNEIKAVGVELVDGRKFEARREVVLSCGAARSPQVLMLSGIGPKDELDKHGITQVLDLPVGFNLHDHYGTSLYYKLRAPETGLALGSPLFNKPSYFTGNPMDYFTNGMAPDEDIIESGKVDGTEYRLGPRCDFEITCMYVVTPQGIGEPLPINGEHITISILNLNPTSRGRLTLRGKDPIEHPLLDPAYYSTEHDRAILRAGTRAAIRIMESPAGQKISIGETAPGTYPVLNSKSTSAQLDERIEAGGISFNHLAGGAAMGTVVDSSCRVKGVDRLRVVDTSIMPVSITAHLQAPMYGIAERAAAMILADV